MTPTLSSRIKHLLVSQARQDKLAAELKNLKPGQVQLLHELLDQHDEECLQILDQKVEEQQAVHDRLMDQVQQENGSEGPDPESLRQFIVELFSDPKALAEFFVSAGDQVIEALQTIIVESAEPEQQVRFKAFFKEMRLRRASLYKQDKEAVKQVLIEDITAKQEAIKEMDALIAESNQLLKEEE